VASNRYQNEDWCPPGNYLGSASAHDRRPVRCRQMPANQHKVCHFSPAQRAFSN